MRADLYLFPSHSFLLLSQLLTQKNSLVSPSRDSQLGCLFMLAVPRVGYNYAVYWTHQPSEYLSEAWDINSFWPEHTWPQADPSIYLSLPYTKDHFMQAMTHD